MIYAAGTKTGSTDIVSEAYTIDITVKDVDTVLKDRLSTQIEQYLRGAVQHLIIATSLMDAATFDLACAISYPT